ncbi:extracellular solute-binding protein [Agrobacterium albertimagni AOL15]|uniref:Extracellular solute-binding protein n=1 Tax=Agrobacterium albertimagni AOL15 TaxID=1156935 RepID=K2QXX9_9HYPH|nr:extracellular solute-binding protein [Agrobacterium albertimagni]EKF60317.1 extracellular solute-binding protein [Agrobacterium albertimagni AOL15]
MLDLNDLRLFVHIVDHQGILKAGRALRLPKSTMSRRLAALEEQLKSRLVIRSGDEFRLTAVGEETYRLGLAMVEAAQQAEDRLMRPTGAISGRVSINVSPLLASSLGAHVGAMMQSHSGLDLVLDLADRVLDQNSDTFDLYLCAHHWPLRDSPLIQRRICRNPLLMVASPEVAARVVGTGPASLEFPDLFVHGMDASATEWPFQSEAGDTEVLACAPRLTTTNVDVLLSLALSGAGLVLVPEFAIRQPVADGLLVPVMPGWVGPTLTMTLLSPPRRLMNTTLRRVADELGAYVKTAVLQGIQPVPNPGQGVLKADRSHFMELSSSTPSQGLRADKSGVPTLTLAESEIAMRPFFRAFGVAALTIAAAIPLPAAAEDAPGPLVLYTNDFEGVITDRFEADTGRQIDVVQMSGGEILARIAAEAANPQWDVLIFNGSYSFKMLDDQNQLLRGVEPANIGNLNETGRTYLPENRSWFPIGMAASCVMLYRTDTIDNPPTKFADLADSRFNGKFGMADPAIAAPAYPCVAEFFHTLGKDKAEAYFTSLFDNGMRVFRTNGPVGRAIVSGELDLALITSQVAYSLKAAGEAPVEVVWPEEGAPGVVRGVGIQASTKRSDSARIFVEWLLKPETQTYLSQAAAADGLFEPTVDGTTRRADGPAEGVVYRVAPDDFSVANEAEIKTWFADRALQ